MSRACAAPISTSVLGRYVREANERTTSCETITVPPLISRAAGKRGYHNMGAARRPKLPDVVCLTLSDPPFEANRFKIAI